VRRRGRRGEHEHVAGAVLAISVSITAFGRIAALATTEDTDRANAPVRPAVARPTPEVAVAVGVVVPVPCVLTVTLPWALMVPPSSAR